MSIQFRERRRSWQFFIKRALSAPNICRNLRMSWPCVSQYLVPLILNHDSPAEMSVSAKSQLLLFPVGYIPLCFIPHPALGSVCRNRASLCVRKLETYCPRYLLMRRIQELVLVVLGLIACRAPGCISFFLSWPQMVMNCDRMGRARACQSKESRPSLCRPWP